MTTNIECLDICSILQRVLAVIMRYGVGTQKK